jgi:hypothetical protein
MSINSRSVTFGIVTSGENHLELNKVIKSIQDLELQDYEIVVVGNAQQLVAQDVRVIEFDETRKQGWITKKKNLITQNSTKHWIIYLHDYFIFEPSPALQTICSRNQSDIIVPKVVNSDGKRFRDWILWVDNGWPLDWLLERTRRCMLPYFVKNLTQYQYISGGIWIAKREFMMANPLNEELSWGEAEDVEWSLRVRDFAKIEYAHKVKVISLRDKPVSFKNIDPITLLFCVCFAGFRRFGEWIRK